MSETIHWRAWSESAFAAASAENKPILLSLVTAWSEECAAMEATTYASPSVIATVGGRFVAVRVDADRRPDVNERYNLGGWPTTAALTPDGHVLNGGTHFTAEALTALLTRAADAWRDHAADIRARARPARLQPAHAAPAEPDTASGAWLRSLLVDQFDADNGGFGAAPKYPHARALEFALALVDEDADETLRDVVEITLERIGALWDPAHGGFYRYSGRSDWADPATEKTLEDNAALLNLYLDAGERLQSDEYRNRAGELVRWIRNTLADQHHGGFYNSQAAVSRLVDRSMYVDRNAEMAAAFLRAAAVFQDPWLRDFALKSLEAVILPGYKPGGGVAHVAGPGRPALRTDDEAGRVLSDPPDADVRGLLGDQVRVASALIWAHVATGQLPYSMLALELMQFAMRTMWDDQAACFRDRAPVDGARGDLGLLGEPARPFALNCEAACVLDRLATITADQAHRGPAQAILRSLAADYQQHGLFAAPYALAVREVIDHRLPLGLRLSRVEWNLEHD